MPSAFVPLGADGIDQNKQRQQCHQQHHHRAQTVTHQNDAKGRRPIAKLVEHDRAVRRLAHETKGNRDHRQNTCDREHPLDTHVIARGENDKRCKDRR